VSVNKNSTINFNVLVLAIKIQYLIYFRTLYDFLVENGNIAYILKRNEQENTNRNIRQVKAKRNKQTLTWMTGRKLWKRLSQQNTINFFSCH